MSESFDVAVIGGGPGGYSAAIRCAQKGVSVALIEKAQMGGTCLNRGCIPSKALLASAHFLTLAKHAHLMGLEVSDVKPNWPKMQERKNAIVTAFRKGVTALVQANKIKLFEDKGIVTAPGKVKVQSDSSAEEIAAKNIILATGSEPIEIPDFPFDGKTIISSNEALNLTEIPKSMVIIGGGVIGCELACVYAAVGCKVTIVEALWQLLVSEDKWIGQLIARELKKQKIESLVGEKVIAINVSNSGAQVTLQSGNKIEAERVLVAVGRKAVCDKETVDNLSLEINDRSAIAVNEKMQTNVKGLYAIGDAVGTTYLAHGAFAEAEVAAANVCGSDEKIKDYSLIPRAVYTFPEVASVGKNENKCAEMGIETVVGKATFKSNGRSVTHNEGIGQVRVIRNKADDTIMGVTMVGATVTEMISTARALIGTKEKITDICFAHPTVSEVLKEAWEDSYGLSLHMPPGK